MHLGMLRCPALTAVAVLIFARAGMSRAEEPPSSRPGAADASHTVTFTDVARDSGLDFVHTTGATGQHHFPEINSSGCALFDYDNDGDLDVYVASQNSALYRNNGSGVFTLVNVTPMPRRLHTFPETTAIWSIL